MTTPTLTIFLACNGFDGNDDAYERYQREVAERAFIYLGDRWSIRIDDSTTDRTHARSEPDDAIAIQNACEIAQEVWDAGNFWTEGTEAP